MSYLDESRSQLVLVQKSTYANMADELEGEIRALLDRKNMMNRDKICLKVARRSLTLR